MAITWPIMILATLIYEVASRQPCPPCPATPPCKCSLTESDSQSLVCPGSEFPILEDASSGEQQQDSNRWCVLTLENSSFTEIPANAFANVRRHEIVIAQSNAKLSAIRAFAFNTTTQKVVIEANRALSIIEPNAFAIKKGEWGDLTLQLSDLKLSNVILNPETFLGAENIMHLTMIDSINSITEGLFKHIDKLTRLMIIGDTDIRPLAFSHMENLSTLLLEDLHVCRVTKEMFAGLGHELDTLYISPPWHRNDLPSIDDDAFEELTKLKELAIQSFDLKTIPASVFGLSQLENLIFFNNSLTSSSFKRITSETFPNLREINISFNNLRKIPKFLKDLPLLRTAHVDQADLPCGRRLCWLAKWQNAWLPKKSENSVRIYGRCAAPPSKVAKTKVLDFVRSSAVCSGIKDANAP